MVHRWTKPFPYKQSAAIVREELNRMLFKLRVEFAEKKSYEWDQQVQFLATSKGRTINKAVAQLVMGVLPWWNESDIDEGISEE